MRTAAVMLLIGLVASPAAAQGRGGRYGERVQRIPPGHLPPPGECRVWYDDRPAGHQPPPTNCRDAERIASRDRYARVIYGGGDRRDDVWREDPRDRGRSIPRGSRYPYPDQYPDRYPDPDRYPYPERSPYPDRYPERRYPIPRYPNDPGRNGQLSVPFDNGYDDGYDKGLEDARDNDAYDPSRHSRYRSADRGYNRRYGTKAEYQSVYRDGFRAGYDDGYRGSGAQRRGTRSRFPWPF
jgi:hypothetical protein